MKVLIVGGFLGSGKTTVILHLARSLVARGASVAIIENEFGTVGIDQEVLGETDIAVTPLFGGCVCCQLAGDLLTATTKIHEDLDPDVLIIEATGVAVPSQLIEVYRSYDEPDVYVRALCVVDSIRWNVLYKAASPLVTSQLKDLDVVIVNKEDENILSEQDTETIGELAGCAGIVHMHAADMTDDEVYDALVPYLGNEEI